MLVTRALSRLALVAGIVLVAVFAVPSAAEAAPATVRFTVTGPDGAPTSCQATAQRPYGRYTSVLGSVVTQCSDEVAEIHQVAILYRRGHFDMRATQSEDSKDARGLETGVATALCLSDTPYIVEGQVTVRYAPRTAVTVHVTSPPTFVTCGGRPPPPR